MHVELCPLSAITPYENNPRRNDDGIDAVAASLREFGFHQPIVVDEHGVIIAGHTRYKAACKLSPDAVPVHVAASLSPAQVRAYRIADNRPQLLPAGQAERLARQGKVAGQGPAARQRRRHGGGLRPPLHAWFGHLARVPEPGRAFYVWGGYANLALFPPVLAAHGLYFSQAIVWDKEHPVLNRKDFMGTYELAYYGWKEGRAHESFGPRSATDLWAVKKVSL